MHMITVVTALGSLLNINFIIYQFYVEFKMLNLREWWYNEVRHTELLEKEVQGKDYLFLYETGFEEHSP